MAASLLPERKTVSTDKVIKVTANDNSSKVRLSLCVCIIKNAQQTLVDFVIMFALIWVFGGSIIM